MEVELMDYDYKMQAIQRARKIPSVNYLWDKSTKVYDRMKGTNMFTHWAFDVVENVVNNVLEKSLLLAKLMEKPIYTLDKTLCQGLDYVEVNLPIIKEEPNQILNRTKSIVFKHLRPAVKTFTDLKQETKHKVRAMTLLTYYKVHYFRVYSWQQADKVMSTETGISILKTVDSSTDLAELMLDKYLPATYEEFYTNETEKLCCEHVKLHHTVEKLSEFSSRVSRRIYFALMDRWRHMYRIGILILILRTIIILQAIQFLGLILSFVFKLFNEYFGFCLIEFNNDMMYFKSK
ncbi:lipid storage droplets surface-binding protein 2-like [Colletes gigas]|uniref:lipid storage droplets surface-binding protein 2-like n=1 Tax=Colletes gigas TaxID=935657 RepID=UPI001C9ABC38|nr:lipid storage droplets surface-binding protein 2-like [Colletes gigas]XP_043259023.1 lipid storage droplets surface-binding protein 2-like [Colletes gigas]XP_043259024.1 lipid storage droplets surface-binding protein 2-like [Colletes gigas]